MPTGFEQLLGSLAGKDLISPYFEAGMLADNWPMSYQITIDSSPYYGAGDGYFHPSTHPLMTERELYFRYHAETADKIIQEKPSLQRQMAFAMGSALHGVVQTQLVMMELVEEKDIEVEYINHEHHVRGRIDWISRHPDTGGPLVVEMKTRTVRRFGWQTEPEPSWVAQLNLALDSQDVDLGVLLMVESGYPYRIAEFQVRRDRLLLDEIYAKFDRVRQAIATNTPPRCGCGIDTQEMKKCPVRHLCALQ